MRWESAENRFNEQQTARGGRWRRDAGNERNCTQRQTMAGRRGGKKTQRRTQHKGRRKTVQWGEGEKRKRSETHQRPLERVQIGHLPDAVWVLVDVLGLGGADGERLLDSWERGGERERSEMRVSPPPPKKNWHPAGAGSLQQPQRLSRPASLSWQPTGAPETDGTGRAVKAGKRRRTHHHQNCVSVSIATRRRRRWRRQQLGAPGVIKCREKRAEWGWSRRRARLKRGTKVRRGTK